MNIKGFDYKLQQEIRSLMGRIIPAEVLKMAEELGVEVAIGEQGPVFIGPNELVEKLEDYYESLTTVDIVPDGDLTARDEALQAVHQVKGTQYGGINHKLEAKIVSKTNESLDKREKQDRMRHEEIIRDKEMDKQARINALSKVNPNLKKVAEALGVSINVGKNGKLIFSGQEKLVERVQAYNDKLNSSDFFTATLADSPQEAEREIIEAKEYAGMVSSSSRSIERIELDDSNDSLSRIQDNAKKQYEEEYAELEAQGKLVQQLEDSEREDEEMVRTLDNTFNLRRRY